MSFPIRRTALAMPAAFILACGLLAGPSSRPSRATSHVESPGAILDMRTNGQEVYAFTTPDNPDTVTLIGLYACCQTWYVDNVNFFSLAIGEGFPFTRMEFDPAARYEIHIDPTGTGKPAITYQWRFERGLLPASRRYSLREIRPGRPDRILVEDHEVAPPDLNWATPVIAPSYAPLRDKGIAELPGGGKAFAGKVADPFAFDLRWLAFYGSAPLGVNPSFNVTQVFNTNAIAIEVPKKALALNGDVTRNPVIGVWTTASRKSFHLSGGPTWKQVSRNGGAGWSVLHLGAAGRDRYNHAAPADDHSNQEFMRAARAPEGSILELGRYYKLPPAPRADLYEWYMTGITKAFDGPFKEDLNSQVLNKDADAADFVPSDELRLNMSTPLTPQPKKHAYLDGDKQGWPNGRRLIDEVGGEGIRLQLGEPTYPRPTNKLADSWWMNSPIAEPPGGYLKKWPYMGYPYTIGRFPYKSKDVYSAILMFLKGYGLAPNSFAGPPAPGKGGG